MGWENDKAFSDTVSGEIKSILGRVLIMEGDWKQDALENSDLIVYQLAPVRIGCRIRRYKYFIGKAGLYRSQFTIRAARPSRNMTEMAKIMSGWGDYFFYGFKSADGSRLIHWTLCDLKVFRLHNFRYPQLALNRVPNDDGSSWFCVFEFKDFPGELIKARHWDLAIAQNQQEESVAL